MNRSWLIAAAFAVTMGATARAYELQNHFDMSRAAAAKSVLGDPVTMASLGWRRPINDFFQRFASAPTGFTPDVAFDCYFSRQNVLDLISCGAQFEDIPGSQALNHFFDPAHNLPLNIFGIRPGSLVGLPNLRSPDWALQDAAAEISAAQQRAYRNARQNFYAALTTPDAVVRDRDWGLAFQSLGQVIHHLQDMAQPQHVRNDPHCDSVFPCLIPLGVVGFHNPSLYEKYGTREAAAVRSLAGGADGNGIYPGPADAYRALFSTPRAFFVGSGKGISEFTNANFVSDGTNFVYNGGAAQPNPRFASPAPGPAAAPVAMSVLYPDGVPPFIQSACGIDPANCFLTFYSTSGTDPLTGTPFVNARASTLSIFDSDLQDFGAMVQWTDPETGVTYPSQRVFSLNAFNFAAQHDLLIARAVSYSAGLINYFFRGRLEISEPDQVALGLIDPTQSAGFAKVKFKVKNTTPGEDMANGSLVAVAKFHRNTCYRPDLTGEDGAPSVDILACRTPSEEIIVSDTQSGQTLPSGASPVEMTFNFDPPIPAGATDLFLQVVYRGTLGSEPDAVAVGTQDVFEPSHVMIANATDITEISDHFYTLTQIAAGIAGGDTTFDPVDLNHDHVYSSPPDLNLAPQDWTNVALSFTGPGLNPVATIASLPNGRFARITVLTARPSLDLYVGSYHFKPGGSVNQVDDVGTTFYVSSVSLVRGIYATNASVVVLCVFSTSCNGLTADIPSSTVTDATVPESVTIQYP